MVFSLAFSNPKPVQAQFVTDLQQIILQWQILGNNITTEVKKSAEKVIDFSWQEMGAVALQKALRNALNKIAIDSATWIATGDEGQKPLFNDQPLDKYFLQIADEAAGEFIESAVNNLNQQLSSGERRGGERQCVEQRDDCLWILGDEPSTTESEEIVNQCIKEYNQCLKQVAGSTSLEQRSIRNVAVCQPSSLDAKLKISLGLVEHSRPRAPNCTASEMVKNWESEMQAMYDKYAKGEYWDDFAFVDKIGDIFEPTRNDLGIYLTLESDMMSHQKDDDKIAGLKWLDQGRWKEALTIPGKIKGTPDNAEKTLDDSRDLIKQNFLADSGNAFVDASFVFLNTLALKSYNRLMQGWNKEIEDVVDKDDSGSNLTQVDADPNVVYGDVTVKEKITKILGPAFDKQANLNIANDLSLCPDPENPGPTDCVIDSDFLQAISEKKTVIEAIKDGNLRGSWVLTNNNERTDAYNLRNISILRKHRILPVAWEYIAKQAKSATLMDLISCFDPDDDYSDFSSLFNRRDVGWCQGMIDPNWVLKAPLNFCAKEGIGGQVLNTQIMAGQMTGPNSEDMPSSISITRVDGYCADDMSCINENLVTGDCLAYGYCNEEKRVWTFEHSACPPVYNTCTSFTSPTGKNIAYLENTLDYSICDADNAGCSQYLLRGDFSPTYNKVFWDTSPVNYFNAKLASCSVNNEGCTELIRVRPNGGSNLIMGADFAYDEIGDHATTIDKINDYWPIDINGDGIAEFVEGSEADLSEIQKILKLEPTLASSTVSVYSNEIDSLLPDNFQIIPGYAYTFSANVYFKGDEDEDGVRLIIGDDENYSETTTPNSWQRLFKTIYADPLMPAMNSLNFSIINKETDNEDFVFYLYNLKLEVSSYPNYYTAYGASKTYQKLLPAYLGEACYEDYSIASKDYRLKEDAPAICYNFARQCNRDEVGCILLTNQKNNFSVPAKVAIDDYCPQECEGYDVYVAQDSYFHSQQAENLIPANSRFCSP